MNDFAIRLAGSLTDTQRECLLFYPKGNFGAATRKALIKRGLVHNGQVTTLGLQVIEVIRRPDPDAGFLRQLARSVGGLTGEQCDRLRWVADRLEKKA